MDLFLFYDTIFVVTSCRITIEHLLRRTTFIVLNAIEHFSGGEITVKCNTISKKQESKNKNQKAIDKIQETRNKKQETRSEKQDSGMKNRAYIYFFQKKIHEIKKIME